MFPPSGVKNIVLPESLTILQLDGEGQPRSQWRKRLMGRRAGFWGERCARRQEKQRDCWGSGDGH